LACGILLGLRFDWRVQPEGSRQGGSGCQKPGCSGRVGLAAGEELLLEVAVLEDEEHTGPTGIACSSRTLSMKVWSSPWLKYF
jgi:hypothetical protein